jgi:hypothetical protein
MEMYWSSLLCDVAFTEYRDEQYSARSGGRTFGAARVPRSA